MQYMWLVSRGSTHDEALAGLGPQIDREVARGRRSRDGVGLTPAPRWR